MVEINKQNSKGSEKKIIDKNENEDSNKNLTSETYSVNSYKNFYKFQQKNDKDKDNLNDTDINSINSHNGLQQRFHNNIKKRKKTSTNKITFEVIKTNETNHTNDNTQITVEEYIEDHKEAKIKKKSKPGPVDYHELGVFNINLNFYRLKGSKSKITCHARPQKKDVEEMISLHGINFILTIQGTAEDASELEGFCKEFQISWKHVELGRNHNSLVKSLDSDTKLLFISTIAELYKKLVNEEINLFVHCTHGVHRTGIMVYSILRCFDEDRNSALEALKQIREDTYDNIGEKRINYAEKEVIPYTLEIIKKKEEKQEKENKQLDSNLQIIKNKSIEEK